MSCLERDGRLFELHVFTSQTATDLKDIQYSLFKDGVRKTLTMARCFEHEKRACDTLRQLILTHNKMEIRAAFNKFLKGEWESLRNKCRAKGDTGKEKIAADPLSASPRTSSQTNMMAQKQARADNLYKANQTVCSRLCLLGCNNGGGGGNCSKIQRLVRSE